MEGFDFDDIIERDDEQKRALFQEMACQLCQFAVARDACICSQKNSHIYCLGCIQRLSKCALCDIQFDFAKQRVEEHKNTTIRSLIAKIFSIKCKNSPCETVLPCHDQQIQEHGKICSFAQIPCRHAPQCSAQVLRGELQKHLSESCAFEAVQCEDCVRNLGAEQAPRFLRDALPRHVNEECTYQLVRCEKCEKEMTRATLNQREHLIRCAQVETSEVLAQHDSQIQQLKQEIDSLRLQNKSLVTEIQQLKQFLLQALPNCMLSEQDKRLRLNYECKLIEFSNDIKHQSIEIIRQQNGLVSIANKSEKGGIFIPSVVYALAANSLSTKCCSLFSFKLLQQTNYPVRIGIASRRCVTANKFLAPEMTLTSGAQHGGFTINTSGYLMWSGDKAEAGKQVNFSFVKGDTVYCLFDPIKMTIGFGKQPNFMETTVPLRIDLVLTPIENDLYPVVALRQVDDSIQLNSELREYLI